MMMAGLRTKARMSSVKTYIEGGGGDDRSAVNAMTDAGELSGGGEGSEAESAVEDAVAEGSLLRSRS